MVSSTVSSTADLRLAHLSQALTAVHRSPCALSRADLSRYLGCTRATAGTLIADLERYGLVQEKTTLVTGGRGRPSALLGPCPDGPVVVALEIAPDLVRVAHVPITGGLHAMNIRDVPAQDVDQVLMHARELLWDQVQQLGSRVAGVGVALHELLHPGTGDGVLPDRTVPDVLGKVLPQLGLPAGVQVQVVHVATAVVVAEVTRGRTSTEDAAPMVLVLHADTGIRGALVLEGRPVVGRAGQAGDYGHVRLGVQDLVCRCGARGCWETEVARAATARATGADPGGLTASAVERTVVLRAAQSLGRGVGVLVGMHDPDLVVLSGWAADLFRAAPDVVRQAASCSGVVLPPLEVSVLGEDAALTGAAEAVFEVLLQDVSRLGR